MTHEKPEGEARKLPPEPALDNTRVSLWRLAANLAAVGVLWITAAPIGVLFLFGRLNWLSERHADLEVFVFRVIVLAVAGYGALTRRVTLGKIITFLLLGLAVLNLKGCLAGLAGIGRATGG